jgi:hypothetical protein
MAYALAFGTLFVAVPVAVHAQRGGQPQAGGSLETRIADLANTALGGGMRLRVYRGRPFAPGEFELRPPLPGMDCVITFENVITCRRAFVEDNEADEFYQDLLDIVRDVLPEWVERDLGDSGNGEMLDRIEFTRGGVSLRVFATETSRTTAIWLVLRPL